MTFDQGSDNPIGQIISDLLLNRAPRLFVLSGPSGVGKDAVVKEIAPNYPDIHLAITATTRARRPGDIDGIDYYFLDLETFRDWLEQGEFVEFAEVYGNLYGVPLRSIRLGLERGQDVLVKVDVQGAQAIKKLVPTAALIFLSPGNADELYSRLRHRASEDEAQLLGRFRNAVEEMNQVSAFDYIVYNRDDGLQAAVEDVTNIIESERHRVNQVRIVLPQSID